MLNFFKPKFKDESKKEQLEELKRFPNNMMQKAIEGLDCDILPGATGEFGRCLTNPIPVNGPYGEIKYLSRLTIGSGYLLFHRLGAVESIDVYEIVSADGKFWDILYLDMNHPRRSTLKPEGYEFRKFHELLSRHPIGMFTNSFDPDFPFGLSKYIIKTAGGQTLVNKYEEITKDKTKFERPTEHKEKINNLNLTSQYSG